jgi:hypothetical protein
VIFPSPSVVASQQGKPWFPPSAGQENTTEVAMLSMPHARAEGNVAQGDTFFKSVVQPAPAHNKSLQRLRSKFTCSHRSIRVKPIHVRDLFVKNAGRTRREHIFGDYAASPPIQGVRCHGKISEIDRDAAICDDRYLRSDLGSRYGDPRHKVRRCPSTEAGCSFLKNHLWWRRGWRFRRRCMPIRGLFYKTGSARL